MLITERLKEELFSPSEQAVAVYMLEQRYEIKGKTTKQISQETFTNPATLVRIAKKLGFSGWNELKESYLEEIRYLDSQFEDMDANFPFQAKDNAMTIANRMAALNHATIQDTLSLLHYEDLIQAVGMLERASEIQVFASNENLLISQDFVLKLNRIRKYANICITDGEQPYAAFNCRKNSCGLLISYSGENKRILQVIQILKRNEIPVVAITSLGNNSLSASADCTLHISTREHLYTKIGNFTSKYSICYLLDVLYSCIFAKQYHVNLDHKLAVSRYADTRHSSVDILNESGEWRNQ